MINGGARSKPGESLPLGVGLYLRMNPKEARNLLSFRITSSASFDMITESELAALRYGTEKVDPHHDAMLGLGMTRCWDTGGCANAKRSCTGCSS
jgi:hypothetical protein